MTKGNCYTNVTRGKVFSGTGSFSVFAVFTIIGYNGQDVNGTEGWETWMIC